LPTRAPVASGVKVTSSVQVAPETTVAGHVEVKAKSPAIVIEAMASAPGPLFMSVTVCALLVVPTVRAANVSDAGVSVMEGAAASPVPESGIVCGLPTALLVTESVPVIGPVVPGANVTLTVHDAPAASDVP